MNKLKSIVGHNIFLLVSALDVSGLMVRVIDGGIKLPQDVLAFAMFGALMLLVVSAMLDFQDELVENQSTLIKKQTHYIKAQQDYIDLALQAAVKAVYVNGNQKGFSRK